jgi:hypothetical protein
MFFVCISYCPPSSDPQILYAVAFVFFNLAHARFDTAAFQELRKSALSIQIWMQL